MRNVINTASKIKRKMLIKFDLVKYCLGLIYFYKKNTGDS